MDLADIYKKFDQIGCLTFATIDQNYPQTRIAHLFAYDHEGLYFRTMIPRIDGLVKNSYFRRFRKKFEIKACECRGMKRTYGTLQ